MKILESNTTFGQGTLEMKVQLDSDVEALIHGANHAMAQLSQLISAMPSLISRFINNDSAHEDDQEEGGRITESDSIQRINGVSVTITVRFTCNEELSKEALAEIQYHMDTVVIDTSAHILSGFHDDIIKRTQARLIAQYESGDFMEKDSRLLETLSEFLGGRFGKGTLVTA